MESKKPPAGSMAGEKQGGSVMAERDTGSKTRAEERLPPPGISITSEELRGGVTTIVAETG